MTVQSAANRSDEPAGADTGKSGSWQGAELRQGEPAKEEAAGAMVAFLTRFGVGDFSTEPQQHEVPRHFDPHGQTRACESGSNEADPVDTLEAETSPVRTAAKTNATTGQNGRGDVNRLEFSTNEACTTK